MADELDLKLTEVSGPKEALVGDEAVYKNPHVVEPEIVQEDVPAVNAPEEDRHVDTIPLNEVYVQMDTVVTDPSSPEAVQIPDAGRGTNDLPIHSLLEGTVEDKFAAGENDEDDRALPGTAVVADDEPAPAGTKKGNTKSDS